MAGSNRLHRWILAGMGVGLALGLGLSYAARSGALAPEGLKETVWWLDLFGKDLFVGSLKMLIAPLIFASIVSGVTSLPNMKELGAVGTRTFAYYFLTTGVAVAIGLAAVLILRPGHQPASQALRERRAQEIEVYEKKFLEANPGGSAASPEFLAFVAAQEGEVQAGKDPGKWQKIAASKDRGPAEMLRQDILLPILSNPIKSLADTNSLGIICFAILLGIACTVLGARAAPVTAFFQGLNEVMLCITLWIMTLAPVSIGCLLASTVASQGVEALVALGWYCATVVIGIALHVCFLLGLVTTLGGMPLKRFVLGIREAWLIAFSTTSSAATLPVTLECAHNNLGVSTRVSGFTLPIGATCNMDGTALYEGVAVIFMLQIYGGLADVPIELTAAKTLIIFITAVLASIGAAAVPSAGLITMAIVAGAVGLPLYYIPVLFAVDHLLDMFRTSTNVLGDVVGAVIIERWEQRHADTPSPEA